MIYFDNAAATRPSAASLAAFTGAGFGNSSSLHGIGFEAEKTVSAAARLIAGRLGVSPEEIVFTSGGTESNNTALRCCFASRSRGGGRRRVITTRAEHPSVTAFAETLKHDGIDLVYAKLGKDGAIDEDDFRGLITPETALVSVAAVNGETGVIQPVARLSAIVKEKNPDALFHCDAVQSFGKTPLGLGKADYASFSAHKIHGVKGIGALFARKGAPFTPLIIGGGHQGGRRGGTENAPACAAFAAAVDESFDNMAATLEKVTEIRNYIAAEVTRLGDIFINGGDASPFVLNFSVLGVGSEITLHTLEERGIYVSAGSACSSRQRTVKAADAYGLPKIFGESAVRLSFGRDNSLAEAEEFVRVFKEVLPNLRKYGGKVGR